jgi:2-oxoglutarate dehydrogenase E1 component
MYESWKKDPQSVHASWDQYFRTSGEGILVQPVQSSVGAEKEISDHVKILQLINAYQFKGHEIANLDPLNLDAEYKQHGRIRQNAPPPDLDYKYYGFTEADLDKEFPVILPNAKGLIATKNKWKLRDLIAELKKTYCETITLERSHITKAEESDWLVNKMEAKLDPKVLDEGKKVYFDELQWTSLFEEFLAKKYTTTKRFSASGSDALLPCLKLIMNRAIELGVDKIIIGMPHRGRVNVMTHLLHKELEQILAGFQGAVPIVNEAAWGSSGDVKYHLGSMYEYTDKSGRKIEIQLMPNPSHLESIDPITMGRVRAEQDYTGDKERKKVLGILVHGDAAFSGQGVVYETMQFLDLNGYRCGGTVHVIVNNQIGFTTVPRDSRSGYYCTDIAKSVGAPVFHLNSEDPEAVVKASRLAAEYRQQFSKDVVIDLFGYRLYGHNEMEQPMFTQPIMYKKIQSMVGIYNRLTDKFVKEGFLKKEDIEARANEIKKGFEDAFVKAKDLKFNWEEWRPKVSNRLLLPFERQKITGVDLPRLRKISNVINKIPDDFAAHPLVRKVYEQRKNNVAEGKNLDWATGEALAWATLLEEGHDVRISGQDVQRGTFSHRHSYLHSQERDRIYIPLRHIGPNQGHYTAHNSSLSELAVLGFEIGYEYANPNSLVIWEGQFGDFANGAQVMIDTYIAAGETKWGVQSGIVLLLPHGYDGQGAEHSSARLERFLQMTDDDPYALKLPGYLIKNCNWQVVNCTTPSNYFHVLRRQLRRDFRKPLIVMSPKRLLRLREAVSNIEDFSAEKKFKNVIPEVENDIVPPEKVEKLIVCSGQVYYDLVKARSTLKKNKISIIRLEQIAPFPGKELQEQLDKHPNAKVMWCQEEHLNMGAWDFVRPRANTVTSPPNS